MPSKKNVIRIFIDIILLIEDMISIIMMLTQFKAYMVWNMLYKIAYFRITWLWPRPEKLNLEHNNA